VGHHALQIGHSGEIGLMILSATVAVAFLVLAWRLYADGPAPDERFGERRRGLYRTLSNAYFVDQAYDRGVVASVMEAGRVLWRFVDVGIIDASVNGLAAAAQAFSASWRRWAGGNVHGYALTFLVGLVLIVAAIFAGASS
jgi:NADH-quinone oxidoreductase subunit L